jgi:hypothetical protein
VANAWVRDNAPTPAVAAYGMRLTSPTQSAMPHPYEPHTFPASAVTPESTRATVSAVSWGAIMAGAAAAAGLSLIMLLLGTGLGLSAASPWPDEGMRAAAFGVSTILWLSFTQLVASGIGGFIAGRLRSTWTAHADEVYFRDTAHGFLTWAVATLATAVLLVSATGSMVKSGLQAGTAATGAFAATAGTGAGPADHPAEGGGLGAEALGYFVDSLFRTDRAPDVAAAAAAGGAALPALEAGEVTRIFANAVVTGVLGDEDRGRLTQIVAQRTGQTPAEADKRVVEIFARVQVRLRETEAALRATADTARKASAAATLWLAIALLLGAFVASWAAMQGGRRRVP